MTDAEIEAEARKLYGTSPQQVKPTWDQLGEATKVVWRSFVLAGQMTNLC